MNRLGIRQITLSLVVRSARQLILSMEINKMNRYKIMMHMLKMFEIVRQQLTLKSELVWAKLPNATRDIMMSVSDHKGSKLESGCSTLTQGNTVANKINGFEIMKDRF